MWRPCFIGTSIWLSREAFNLAPTNNVYFWQSFWHLTCKKNACQLTCIIQNLTCSVTCEEENHTSKSERTRTTRYVTLRWHFREKYRCRLPFIFVFENVMWHLHLKIEHQNEIRQTNTLATSTNTVEMVLRGRGIIHVLSFCTTDSQLCGAIWSTPFLLMLLRKESAIWDRLGVWHVDCNMHTGTATLNFQ